MSGIMTILLLTIFQFIAGFGVINLFNIELKPGLTISLSVLLGIAVFSIVPFLLQLAYIPLTQSNVFISLFVACILLNLKFKSGLTRLNNVWANGRFKIKLYELPFLAMLVFIFFVSVWRAYYFPPTPRDATSGPEAIAEFAIREKTMINSVFGVNDEVNNNVFKSPFLISLQIIYKYAGFAFGQIWLSSVVGFFLVFLYHALSQTVHKLFAGLLMLAFIMIPEMYAYTFMMLYDYSNAVFFFLSVWFLIAWFQNRQSNYLGMAGFLMALATYIRTETLILGCLMAPCILWYYFKNKTGIVKGLIKSAIFIVPSVLAYILSVSIYINMYLPSKYDVGGQVNKHLGDLSPLFTRFADINGQLIFSEVGFGYYGYFIYFFLILLALEIIFKRSFNSTARSWLYAVLVVYIGYALLGYLLPLLDLNNSTKRGLFKLFPLMLLYMSNNALLIGWSKKITQWEAK